MVNQAVATWTTRAQSLLAKAEKRKTILLAEQKADEGMFAAAWEQYGSELAGGTSDSLRIKNALRDIEEEINLLKDFLDGKVTDGNEPLPHQAETWRDQESVAHNHAVRIEAVMDLLFEESE